MAAGLCIAGFIVILSLFLWLSENTKLKKAINKIPGPPTLPIVGNAHQFKPDGSGIKLAIFLVYVRTGLFVNSEQTEHCSEIRSKKQDIKQMTICSSLLST